MLSSCVRIFFLVLASFLLALAISFALGTNVVAKHRTENEVLLWRELAQWFGDNHSDSIQAFTFAEE